MNHLCTVRSQWQWVYPCIRSQGLSEWVQITLPQTNQWLDSLSQWARVSLCVGFQQIETAQMNLQVISGNWFSSGCLLRTFESNFRLRLQNIIGLLCLLQQITVLYFHLFNHFLLPGCIAPTFAVLATFIVYWCIYLLYHYCLMCTPLNCLFSLSGPFWTHILFTWTKKDGLKVYINGTFTAGDPVGNVSDNYGDPYPDLVIGSANDRTYGHYLTGAFDEFVIWEKALSANEIMLYYSAAIGRTLRSCGNYFLSFEDIAYLL